MSTDIFAFFACALNVIGILIFMINTQELIQIYRRTPRRYKIAAVVGIALISELVVYTDIYLIVVLAAEAAGSLLWSRKQENVLHVGIKGITSLLALMVTEIAVGILFYYQKSELLTEAQTQVEEHLAMATMLFILNVFQKTGSMEKGVRKMLCLALEIKALENLAWLGICIQGGLVERD